MSLDELLFYIEYQLTKEFPALSPFDVEEETFFRVIDLLSDTRKLQMRQKKESDPNRVIKRPAGDNWF